MTIQDQSGVEKRASANEGSADVVTAAIDGGRKETSPTLNDVLWNRHFEELCDFMKRHGHLRATQASDPGGKLLRWQRKQREKMRQGRMSPERQERLDSIGFQWIMAGENASSSAEHNEALWRTRFNELVRFQKDHGHTNVPNEYQENRSLGRWVSKQREKHRHDRLEPEHLKELESIGFAWRSSAMNNNATWEEDFEEMAAFIRQHGHDQVPSSDEASARLATWRDRQRAARRKGRILPDRKARLDAIGFTWSPPRDPALVPDFEAVWEARFGELLAFKEMHGHVKVPTLWNGSPTLGRWVQKQHENQARGTLRPDRKNRLDEIGFTWEGRLALSDTKWEVQFAKLVEFKREHGHERVPKSKDALLAKWVGRQRETYRAGGLQPERRAKLEAIGFAWDGTMRPDHQKRQDAVGFVWAGCQPSQLAAASSANSSIALWDQSFAALRAFAREHGHLNVPDEGGHQPLAAWLAEQRRGFEFGRLSFTQVTRLEQLGVKCEPPQPDQG